MPQDVQHLMQVTLLHKAADVPTIDEILKHAVSVPDMIQTRRTEKAGWSVLHTAVNYKRPVRVICKLLKLGVDPLAKNNNDQTPADLARAEGQTLIAQLLDRAAQDKQATATA